MSTNKTMPCITLSRDFDIIDIDPRISLLYPELCDKDYIRSLFSGVRAEELSALRLINTALVSRPDIRLAAVAEDDIIRCYIMTADTSSNSKQQDLISYQMREPISSIFALLPIITDNINNDNSDKAIMYLDSIYSKSYKLLRNVTNMSVTAKILNGDSFKTTVVDLSALMESLITSISTIEKNVKIHHEIEENIIVNANLSLLTNGILNLFANSFDYKQDADVEIRLKLAIKGKKAVFTYSDNSKGIKEQFLPMVFNPYFSKDPYDDGQADPSLGLGLFIAKAGFTHAGASLLLTSKFGEGVKYSASFPVCPDGDSVLRSSATDFLLNRYSEIFVQLCDSCKLPSLK
ncbi:MAG: HAMP domain-containing histidine kinase [Oscillospiraceae bacterium]|nr:HAMP domain-containing histidine kinase [Oscillospiraceae bacterium]